MTDRTTIGLPTRPLNRASMVVVSLAILATFGGIVGYVTLELRQEIRGRILDRAASSFEQVVTSEYRRFEEAALNIDYEGNKSISSLPILADPSFSVSDDPFINEIILGSQSPSSSLEEPLDPIDEIAVWGLGLAKEVDLFAPDGLRRDSRPDLTDKPPLSQAIRATVSKGTPLVDLSNETGSNPELIVTMAFLRDKGEKPTGYARFLLNGTEVVEELTALDDNLRQQAGIAFLAGGFIIAGILWFFFNRLQRSSQLLAERSEKLAQANEKLVLASKSATLGSISAHLMHGLKNPLAGLREFVKGRESSDPSDEEIQLVAQAAGSMQNMVEEALQVLQEQTSEGVSYAFTVDEMMTILEKRLAPLADEKGVSLQVAGNLPEASIDNLGANLLVLALFNLGQNAIEATPEQEQVSLDCKLEGNNRVAFRVRDTGLGLPVDVAESPFAPRTSRKKGGSGVGLSISQQLVERAGAELSLESNGPEGACFLVLIRANDTNEEA